MNTRFATTLLLFLFTIGFAHAQVSLLPTLHPYPKAAFAREGFFPVNYSTVIVAPENPGFVTTNAIKYLQQIVKEYMGFTVPVVGPSTTHDGPMILIGTRSASPQLAAKLAAATPRGEMAPDSGGYVLDITSDLAIIAGTDPSGIFNGVSTFAQLMIPGDVTAFVQCVHIWDYPDYPIRWVFSQHNLRGPGQLAALRTIQDTMAFYKLNGIQQNDFKYNLLDQQPRNYFDSAYAFLLKSFETNTEIIPGVAPIGYSEGILWHNPNLAEGFPARARYVIEGDTGRLIPDPRVTLPNGGFENLNASQKFTGWSFYDEGAVTPDKTIFHSGTTSARCSNFVAGNSAGNCRFNRRVDCDPHRAYLMSAWLKTEDLVCDQVQLLAIGVDDNNNSRVLTFTAFNIPRTTDWMKVETVFNTLGYNHVLLYAGVWGGRSGTIWWDDFTIQDAGLTNVLRREGAPLHIKKSGSGTEYIEGIDFAPVVDSIMLKNGGSYPYHRPPTLRRRTAGAMKNGDTVDVSWFHPMTTVVDERGYGSTMVCVSEDTLYTILKDQISRVDTLYGAKRLFMGHDEIRSMNWDSSCQERHLTPAQLLADNVKRTLAIIEGTHRGAQAFVWSDMFDSLHNAYNNYYLINGDLTGVWDLIPRSTVIVNWNGGKKKESIQRFSRLGFPQITSPYYDVRSTSNMRAWRLAMEGTDQMLGMMYTTWSQDYTYLKPFAYYAWGAGPYVIHTPLDTTVLPSTPGSEGSVCFSMRVVGDPYDPTDSITDVKVFLTHMTGGGTPVVGTIHLKRDSGDVFTGCADRIPWKGFRYVITATNAQGLQRVLPEYDVTRMGFLGVEEERTMTSALALRIEPNPAANSTTIAFTLPQSGAWSLRMIDLLGNTVMTRTAVASQGRRHETLDLSTLPSGLYRCEIVSGQARAVESVRVVR